MSTLGSSLYNIFLTSNITGIKLYDDDFIDLVVKFFLNLVFVLAIVRFVYYTNTRRKEYLFTFILVSFVAFFLCFALSDINIDTGMGLGLFAIFGIIRYRTNTIPIREMTFLFIVIGISVVNALANKKVSYAELLFINFSLLFLVYGLEKLWLMKHEVRQTVVFEKIDLINRNNLTELKKDLEERTGLIINRVEIGKIDYLRDVAEVRLYYYETSQLGYIQNEDDSLS